MSVITKISRKNIFSIIRSAPQLNLYGSGKMCRELHVLRAPNYLSPLRTQLAANIFKPASICANIHTKAERELVEFLTEEIVLEKKTQKKSLPSEIEGFKIKMNGADVQMEKQTGKEKILVTFNVNHTVDAADNEASIESSAEKPEFTEMKSRPPFKVEIVKGAQTLRFMCSFLQGEAQEGEYNDVFSIDEVSLFEGEWSEKVYAVEGDVLDGYLYDLLMNLLEQKGVSNEFAEKLSGFSTAYEHNVYIAFLEGISKFTIT